MNNDSRTLLERFYKPATPATAPAEVLGTPGTGFSKSCGLDDTIIESRSPSMPPPSGKKASPASQSNSLSFRHASINAEVFLDKFYKNTGAEAPARVLGTPGTGFSKSCGLNDTNINQHGSSNLTAIGEKVSLASQTSSASPHPPVIRGIPCSNALRHPPVIPAMRPYTFWSPSIGKVGGLLGFDTETELIVDGVTIPRLVLGIAADESGSVFFISPNDIGGFLEIHRDSALVLHTAHFDRNVVLKAAGIDLIDWLERGQLLDVGILFRLHHLAWHGDIPHEWRLDVIAKKLLGVDMDKGKKKGDSKGKGKKKGVDKDEDIRTSFGQFIRPDGCVDIRLIGKRHLDYAAADAYYTIWIHRILMESIADVCAARNVDTSLRLSHDDQLRAAIALDQVSRNGMRIDQDAVARLEAELSSDLDAAASVLESKFGYRPGLGSDKMLQKIMTGVEKELGIRLPRTPTGKISVGANELADFSSHPFISTFHRFKEVGKLISTFVEKFSGKISVNPSFNVLLKTGRVSCSKPNLQQIPRNCGIRELFIPSPGRLLFAADYSCVELCALAQLTFEQSGHSVMRDALNDRRDLHRVFAAKLTGKREVDVDGEERRLGKCCNFGLAGGLGAASLTQYAKNNYDLILSADEAAKFRESWFDFFPEMRDYFGAIESTWGHYALDCNPFGIDDEYIEGMFRNTISGNPVSKRGCQYSEDVVEWIWSLVEGAEFSGKEKFADDISMRQGSEDLATTVERFRLVRWPSGMVRSNCSFTEALNNPFQGLVASGAKKALWRLFREGFHIVNFLHDEILIELPVDADHLVLARRIETIMCEEMGRSIPDVELSVEYALMERWSKKAKAVFDDPANPTRLLVWRPEMGKVK